MPSTPYRRSSSSSFGETSIHSCSSAKQRHRPTLSKYTHLRSSPSRSTTSTISMSSGSLTDHLSDDDDDDDDDYDGSLSSLESATEYDTSSLDIDKTHFSMLESTRSVEPQQARRANNTPTNPLDSEVNGGKATNIRPKSRSNKEPKWYRFLRRKRSNMPSN